MPVKQKHTTPKHSRSFLKVYTPYLPLLLIIGLGLFLSFGNNFKQSDNRQVLSYASNIQADGLTKETNQERQSNNLAPLRQNVLLAKAAQAKAEDMANRNYWSHNTPDGKEPWYFIDQTGYKYYKSAENLAYGFSSSQTVVSGWMNSPLHKANLLDPVLEEVGFGIVNAANYQQSGPETIVVALYAQPANEVAAATTTKPQTLANKDAAKISYIQTLTKGKAPWSGFAAGLLIGGIIVYLIVTHSTSVSGALRISGRFIIKHPLIDLTLVALLALAAILSQNAGTIY